jgi:hypothetical protein
MQKDKELVLARMFFTSGLIETRPLSWIVFTTSGSFDSDKLEKTAKQVTEGEEVYVAFIDKINGIQLYRGLFTNVRAERNRSGNQ